MEIIIAIAILGGLGLIFGLVLAAAVGLDCMSNKRKTN